ncbi:MAG: CpsB/CapC family capsule biosynthesis tyrosine phosphatase [Desulfosoma sp.]
MIDLHMHCLPGLDDGAADMAEALAMARTAVEDGVSAVAATPHWVPGLYENTRHRILAAVERFRGALDREGISLRVHAGAELHLDPSIPGALVEGKLLTLNDGLRYVLIELPGIFIPEHVEGFWFRLRALGFVPIAAHPERCITVVRKPDILASWVRSGLLVQATAASLSGRFGPEVRRLCERLLERGLVHVIASDSHGTVDRPPRLSEAREAAARIVGEEAARAMVEEVPRRILAGEEVDPGLVRAGRPGRGGWWRRVWR